MGPRRTAKRPRQVRRRKRSIAAQRVFNSPELVGQVVHHMVQTAPTMCHGCENQHDKCRSIWQYTTINRVWHAEVSRLVWRCLSFRRADEIFIKIPSESRQKYANHVRTAAMDSFSAVGGLPARSLLYGVRFPNLSRLDIFFVVDKSDSQILFNRGIRLPEIDGKSVKKLNLSKVVDGPIYGLPENWVSLFKQIPVSGQLLFW